MTTDPPPPRRKWHFKRWFIVLSIAIFAWSAWRVYDKRSAIKEAEALGWTVQYTEPSKEIYADWRNAFRKETWTDGVTSVDIPTSEAFEGHAAIVHRLNPQFLEIKDASTLRDLSAVGLLTRLRVVALHNTIDVINLDALKNLPALESIDLSGSPRLTNLNGIKHLSTLEIVVLSDCTGLTNVDALRDLSALKDVCLEGCTGLRNVDGLKKLPDWARVVLVGCTGLTRESVDALRAALPNAIIFEP